MKSKKIYKEKRKELLEILDDNTLDASQKLSKIKILELIENLDIYQTELSAQNKELIEQERNLLESRDEFKKLFNFAPVTYFQLDKNFKILKYNEKALQLFKAKDLSFRLSDQLSFYVYKEDMIKYIKFIADVKKEGFSEETLRFIFKNEIIYCKVHMKKHGKGTSFYYLTSLIDVTSEIKQEAMILSQAKKSAMGELLGLITHQWKQPLSVVSTTINSMSAEIDLQQYDTKIFQEYIQEINEQIIYMSNTTDDFRSFFDENKSKEIINIKDCVQRAYKLTHKTLVNNDIKLQVEYHDNDDSYYCLGFKHDVGQVLITLISNAKDALATKKKNKTIKISICKKDSHILISVKNNGGIIKENIINKVFDQNFTTKKDKHGCGLGLYIAKKIVEEHLSGKIHVKNTKEEDGVKFTIEVPQTVDKKKE